MKTLNRSVVGLFGAAALWAGMASRADAAFTLTFNPDVNGNVFSIGTGTLNTTALNMQSTGGPFVAAIAPTNLFNAAIIMAGATSTFALESSAPVTGPASYGPGFGPGSDFAGRTFATSSTGDIVGLSANSLVVPIGYISGSPLANQTTYAGQSINSLGLTPGTYNYTWGSGPSADSFSIVISTTVIPEPTALSLLAIGSAFLLRRRRQE